jgi:DNA-binding NtrC family response regulator
MPHILLIEDEFHLLRLYSKMLENGGHTIVSTTTVQAAREMLVKQAHQFDACVSDAQVGSVDAMLLLRDLSQIRGKYDVPVLIISAHLEQYQALCDQLRLHTLAKPLQRAELLTAVTNVIAAHRAGDWYHAGANPPKPSP